jgi:hypothetical protein
VPGAKEGNSFVQNIREEEVCDHQEKCRTNHKNVVIVLMDIGKGTRARFGDCN